MKVAENLPHHQQAECDAKEDKAGIIYCRERAMLKSRQERSLTCHQPVT
jgi:hypothetical protein